MNYKRNYRYERKFFISGITKTEVEKIVNLHPAIFFEIFQKRYVNNIYFDSPDLNSYHDNINGLLKRTKTRIRWYGKLFGCVEKPVLELKIKNGLLGKKLNYSIPKFNIDINFNMQDIYNIIKKANIPEIIKTEIKSLQPILLNRYYRKYLLSADKRYRITIDTDQLFYKIGLRNNSFINKVRDDVNIILELKYNEDEDNDAKHVTQHFPFRLTKSSKYVMGLEKIYVQ